MVVRADGNEITLRQYQADGSTGLARGGVAYDEAVVLEVDLQKPATHLDLVEIYAWMGDKDKPSASKSVKVPFDPGAMLARLEDLKEGDWRWGIRPFGPEKEKAPAKAESEKEPSAAPKPAYLTAPGDKADFTVSRGITEPVARALAGEYLLAFEAVSVLLLAALVGAAFLARKEVREA